jgi:arsenite/tail-anchored protein-transporting ATPase
VFPDGGDDPWRAGWVAAQRAVLEQVDQSFTGVEVWRSPYHPAEPVGLDALADFGGALYGDRDPLAVPPAAEPLRITRTTAGAVLRLRLPLVSGGEVDLARDGDDLVVTVGSYRRLLTLPAGLSRHRVAGARVDEGELQVRFAAVPAEET